MSGRTGDLNDLGASRPSPSNSRICLNGLGSNRVCNRSFDQDIDLEKYSLEPNGSLLFDNCAFSELSLKTLSGRRVQFKECSAQRICIHRCDIEKVTFEGCDVQELRIQEIRNSKISLSVLKSDIGTIIVDKSQLSVLQLASRETTVDNVSLLGGAEVNSILVSGAHVGTFKAPSFHGVNFTNGGRVEIFEVDALDYSNASKTVWSLFRIPSAQQACVELRKLSRLFLSLQHSFEERKLYREMDECLLCIREIDCLIRIRGERSHLKRALIWIQYFFVGKLFGWGVSILNSILTALVIILLFVGLRQAAIAIGGASTRFEESWGESVENSIGNFLSIIDANTDALYGLNIVEHAVGIVVITIITGVFVRKIIR